MNRIKQSLMALGGLSVVIGLIALATPRATRGQSGNQQPLNVNVVNTPAVNVGGTVRVSPAAVEPVNSRSQVFITAGSKAGTNPFLTVPTGKQLVVTHVTALVRMPPGERAFFCSVSVEDEDSIITRYDLPSTAAGTIFGKDHYISSQAINFFVPAGLKVVARCLREVETEAVVPDLHLAGYLVDAP